jgi:DNA-binding MarR family transcriptional regulator
MQVGDHRDAHLASSRCTPRVGCPGDIAVGERSTGSNTCVPGAWRADHGSVAAGAVVYLRAMSEGGQREAELLVADSVGALIEFWGFRSVLGRVWAVLYLSEEALPASELCRRLSISTGAASMALTELERWGVVRRRRMPGQRREIFEPETDIWQMVSRVFRERELVQVERALEAFARAEALLDVPARIGDPGERRQARFSRERTARLVELAQLGRSLLRGLVERGRIDMTPLLGWMKKK